MSGEDAADKPDLAQGVEEASLAEGGLLAGTFQGRDVVLARSGPHFYALDATCSHLGAPLADGLVVEGRVHCPWHHARFSLATGEAVAAPALKPLDCFRTSVRGDRVFVVERLQTRPRDNNPPEGGHVLIIGAGAAGYACAEMLAREGFAGRITLISNDPDAPYDRTQCSKQYLFGQSSREQTQFDVPAAIERIEGEVSTLDPDRRTVTVSGRVVAFDTLVLAMGARPVRPDAAGLQHPAIHVLRTLRDADDILAASRQAKRVAILGASFVGLEVAASLRQIGLEVDVVAPTAVPLARVMGADIGQMVRQAHEEKGVRFHLGHQARSFDGKTLHLDHGAVLPADFVVAGVGVMPNTELARAAGLRCAPAPQGGVLVDTRLETSVSGIFAVGDIAAYPDVHSGRIQRIEHWVHAQRQGQHVARVILGRAERFSDVPFFWSAHFDVGLVYVGHVSDIVAAELDGSIEGREFALRLTGPGGEKALIACGRDRSSLLVESHWDRALTTVD